MATRRLGVLIITAAALVACTNATGGPMGFVPGFGGEHASTNLLSQGRLGSRVQVSAGRFEFPGWLDAVDASGRLSTRISADGSIVTVPDPVGAYEPASGHFRVDVHLLARLSVGGRLPERALGGAAPSYNIAQEGRADDGGGFWKMELEGSGTGIGRVRCSFGDGSRSVAVASGRRIDDGRWHWVGCALAAGRVMVTVDGDLRSSSARLGPVSPGGAYGDAVSIGKKPGSTDPADAFSGWMDDVRITKT